MKQPYQALPVDVPPRTWDRGMANLAVGMLALAVLLELVLRLGRLTGGGPYTFVAIGGLFGALLLPIVAIQALRWLAGGAPRTAGRGYRVALPLLGVAAIWPGIYLGDATGGLAMLVFVVLLVPALTLQGLGRGSCAHAALLAFATLPLFGAAAIYANGLGAYRLVVATNEDEKLQAAARVVEQMWLAWGIVTLVLAVVGALGLLRATGRGAVAWRRALVVVAVHQVVVLPAWFLGG